VVVISNNSPPKNNTHKHSPFMINFLSSRVRAIRFAIEGWWYVLRTQQNAWIHALASICVIVMGFWLKLPRQDWAILVLTIAMVWIVEFINTSVEVLTNLASPQRNHLAKITKDVSAAAVLIAAAASVIIGILILGPPLLERIRILTSVF
jgi:diacylglycerol kinase